MPRTFATVVAVAALAGLAGCETPPGPHAPDFGDAIRHNMAVQIVDPEAGVSAMEAPELDAHRTAIAISRYRADRVKPLKELRAPGVLGSN